MAATTSDGFTVVLADDFSGGYKAENWGQPFDGGTYWNGMFQWSKDDVAVRDGEMQVTITRHGDGSWTTGGFNSFKAGKAITYGKIEFDGKVEEAQGTMGVFLTWPLSDDNWPANGEIDILETPAQDVMHTTHWQGADGNHYYDTVRNQSYDETQWNHYELTWLPDRMVLEVNDKVVAEWTDPEHIPDVAHGIGAMGMVAAPHEEWMGGAPDGSTPDKVTISMDNVVMSQWDGKTVPPVEPEPPVDPEPPVLPPAPVQFTIGEGPDTLVLKISQDAYQGDARYTVAVDGAQVGGEFTASAWHSSGQSDTLTLKGDWSPGGHAVEVRFLNDAWGGTADTDRNLHVDGAAYNGEAVEGAAQTVWSDSQAGAFSFTEAAAPRPEPERPVFEGTARADLFDVGAEGGTYTGGGGRDLYVFEAGDGPATVTDFASRADKLVFIDFDAADVATAQATEGGEAGLLVTYGGEDGGSVFLRGVSELAARDTIFA